MEWLRQLTSRVRWFLLASGLLVIAGSTRAASSSSNAVAILNFASDKATGAGGDDWLVSLADYFEMLLQRANVPVVERRQIQLVLAERDLLRQGRISAVGMQAARLPALAYFVSGQLQSTSSNQLTLTVTIGRAESANVEASFVEHGNCPADLPTMVERLARQVAAHLQTKRLPAKTADDRSAITWFPEAAWPFFRGLEYYAHGDAATAVSYFYAARTLDRHFDLARRWEARAYQQCGLSQLAKFAVRSLKDAERLDAKTAGKTVIAVVSGSGVSAVGHASFVREMARNERFTVFEPEWIGAAAREMDLQLTGQMAAPMTENSLWLYVDDVVFLEATPCGTSSSSGWRAREVNLLSGKSIRQATSDGNAADPFVRLAQQMGETEAKIHDDSASSPGSTVDALPEPDSSDSGVTRFAKLIHLVRQKPNVTRYWIGLADCCTSEWLPKVWLLDRAIEVIDNNRTQADAPFLLAAALWRKRNASRSFWIAPDAPRYRELSLQEDFAKLLEWFPASSETGALAEVTLKAGRYTYSAPKDPRYLTSVFDPSNANWRVDYFLGPAGFSSRLTPRITAAAKPVWPDPATLQYLGEMGQRADEMLRTGHSDLAVKIFAELYQNRTIPAANRLTAGCDLAKLHFINGRHFDAIDLLQEVLSQTKGTGLPQARRRTQISTPIESAAFDLLYDIRLFADAEFDFCHCCGRTAEIAVPASPERGVKLLEEIRSVIHGGVGADNRAAQHTLLEHKDEVLPVLLDRLHRGEIDNDLLICCGLLGANAAAAVPDLVPLVCTPSDFQNNAPMALGEIGPPAACAMPALILAAEFPNSPGRNAAWALSQLGPVLPESVPYLARLLDHPNSMVADRAARALLDVAKLGGTNWKERSNEEVLKLVKQWWYEQGVHREWSGTPAAAHGPL